MSIKQCLVAAAVHFTVKHTKTEKVYRANTFVTNIYIKNKTKNKADGPKAPARLDILPTSSPSPPKRLPA